MTSAEINKTHYRQVLSLWTMVDGLKNNQKLDAGHKVGVKAVRDTVEGAAQIGLSFLTLYAFSSENWNRPKKEIDALMELLVNTIIDEPKL